MLHEPEKDCKRQSPTELWNKLPKNKSLFTNGEGLGLPIGNLPSQHNANFLLHWLDMVLEKLGFKYHGRYVDDLYYMFVCETEEDRKKMLHAVAVIRRFLRLYLHVNLHPDKFKFQYYDKGVSFIGAVVKKDRVYVGNRTVASAQDAIYRLNNFSTTVCKLEHNVQSLNSYFGTMRHYDTYDIRKRLIEMISPELWEKIYVKGHYDSVHIKKNPTTKPLPKEEYIKVYYLHDPINYELLDLPQLFDNELVSKINLEK